MSNEDDKGIASDRAGQAGQNPGTGNSAVGTATVTPWYARPLFWSGFLLAGILALLGWLVWQALQEADAARQALEKELAQARETNLAREDFIQQLKILLQADPCDIPAEMAKLTPPPGIIWPPLGSGSLPETIQPAPDLEPDQTAPANPVLILPGQVDDASDPGKGPVNQDLTRSQTEDQDQAEQKNEKAGQGQQGIDSFAPENTQIDQPDHEPLLPADKASPDGPERTGQPGTPDRGMRI